MESATDKKIEEKSEKEKIDQIIKAEKSVTRAVDTKEDMQLQLASNMNDQSMLNTAPMTVAVLGHLILVTLHKDVDLRRLRRYHFIGYPESLRASIIQLANNAGTAFTMAEKNMDQIQRYTAQVPNHVKSCVKLILHGSKDEIAMVLPTYLDTLKTITKKCKEKAKEVEKEFESVCNLTKELQEACAVKQGKYEQNILTAAEEAERKKMELEDTDKHKQELHMARENMKQLIQEAKENYDKQVESMPGAMKLIGMSVADAFCKTISAPGNLIKGLASKFKGSTPEQRLTNYISFAEKAMKELQKYAENDEDGDKGRNEEVITMKASFESQLSSLLSDTQPEWKELEDIFRKAIDVTSHIIDSKNDHDKLKQDMSRLQGMIEAAQLFSQTRYGEMPMSGTGPKMSKFEGDGPFDAYVKQAYFKVECAENNLRSVKDDFERLSEKLEKENSRHMSLIQDLAHVQLDKVDFEKVIHLLHECMGALASVRTQWGKLVRFFKMLSNVIETQMDQSINMFTQTIANISTVAKEPSLQYEFSDVMLDILYAQTTNANGLALLACNVSGMYVQISQDHLTDPLACLGGLLALDPTKDKEEIEDKQKELTETCTEATTAVKKYIEQRREDFLNRIGGRLDRIQREMMAVLPPRPKEDPQITSMKQRAIEEAREQKRQEMEKDMEQYG